MRGAIVGGMVAVGVILGTLALLFAQGAPTAPSVAIAQGLEPGSAKTVPFQFATGYNSISAPNSVWDPNFHITYSVSVAASNGYTDTVASGATSGLEVAGQSGSFYTLVTSIPLSIPAACSGSSCSAVTETITVSSYVTVVTPYKAWFSPTTTAVFKSTPNATCTAAVPCPAAYTGGVNPGATPTQTHVTQDTFMAELLAPLTFLVGFELIAGYAVVAKHPALIYIGVGAIAAGALELAVWVGL